MDRAEQVVAGVQDVRRQAGDALKGLAQPCDIGRRHPLDVVHQLKGTLELVDYAEGMPASYVAGIGQALESIAGLPTDILNTRDDLLGAVHKASYILTLSAEKPGAAGGVPQGVAESAPATLPPAQGPELAQPSVVDSAAECRSRHLIAQPSVVPATPVGTP